MAVFLTIGLGQTLQEGLADVARENSHELLQANSYQDAKTALGFYTCDLVFFLLESSHKDLWPLMMQLAQLPGSPDIIAVVQGHDVEAGAFAIQSGCWDVLSLPCELATISSMITRCLADRKTIQKQISPAPLKREYIIGNSPSLQRLLHQLALVAASDSQVLILGETGTGKELMARAIHDNSNRADKPMIVVDCTNLPATLAESLLFGHAKGSFTGAVESTDGLFKQADGGTIFLDEIGELDLSVQKSLLRVIQERRFRPLSAKNEISCDFRLIAATNQDVEEMVRAGTFRQDLYHRINTQAITMPPLRDRVEDIPMLFQHYVGVFSQNNNLPPKDIAPETLEALKLYPWPGNIREMINVANFAVLKSLSLTCIYPQHLPDDLRLFLVRSNITSQDLFKIASETEHPLQVPEADNQQFYGIQVLPAQHPASETSLFAPKNENYSVLDDQTYSDTIFIQPDGSTEMHTEDHPPGTSSGASYGASSGTSSDASSVFQKTQAFDFSSLRKLPSFKQVRAEFVGKLEAHYLTELIRRCEGNFARAQAISGLSRARLYEILKHNSLTIQ